MVDGFTEYLVAHLLIGIISAFLGLTGKRKTAALFSVVASLALLHCYLNGLSLAEAVDVLQNALHTLLSRLESLWRSLTGCLFVNGLAM